MEERSAIEVTLCVSHQTMGMYAFGSRRGEAVQHPLAASLVQFENHAIPPVDTSSTGIGSAIKIALRI
ncbi:MAG: hypothetical protein DMG80_20505 [Acidobacteria bacterium]|nr:MAG: hypothetical protein DMG80_20505 [Acidobacteriota bacterium]